GHWTSRLDPALRQSLPPGESAAPNAAKGGHVAPVSASNVSNADPAWRSDGVVPAGSCGADGGGVSRASSGGCPIAVSRNRRVRWWRRLDTLRIGSSKASGQRRGPGRTLCPTRSRPGHGGGDGVRDDHTDV